MDAPTLGPRESDEGRYLRKMKIINDDEAKAGMTQAQAMMGEIFKQETPTNESKQETRTPLSNLTN